MRRTRQSIEAEQKFRDAVEEFNQKHNRHIEIADEYQGSKKPVDFYEKTVINDKTYENSWIQQPCEFENGHEGNPLFNTGEADFIVAVDKFNQANSRHIEIVSKYQNANTPVELYEKSVINGKTYERYWKQSPNNFEHGQEGNPLFKTGEADFIVAVDKFNQANNRHIEIASKYQNANTPVELYEKSVINGKTYERRWEQSPSNFEKGHEGNPLFKTGEADFIMAIDKFNQENNRHVTIKGEYRSARKPIELYEKSIINDKTYENAWVQQPANFEAGQEGNPLFNTGKAKFIVAVDKFNQIHNRHIEIAGEYQNANTPVELYEKSVINGKTYERCWAQSPSNFEYGKEGNPLFNTGEADFIVAVDKFNRQNNRNIKIVGEYQNANKPVELYETSIIDDKTYENSWTQRPSVFERGHEGNPLFQKSAGTSFIQEFLYDVLSQYFVPKGYSVENRDNSLFENYDGHPMELDIVVYDENHIPKMALEPSAWYHHQDRVQYDIDKLSICNNNDLYCLLIYFGTESDYKQAIETESIKNYKSENPYIQDNIWIYPNRFLKPTSKKEMDNLTNLVDKLGRVMGVNNLSVQPEININDAINYADTIMTQSNTVLDETSENEHSNHKTVPEKFEEILKTKNDEDQNIFER